MTAPSSYIPTQDSPVTRAADNVTRVLGEEVSTGRFTIYIDFYQFGVPEPGTQDAAFFISPDDDNRLGVFRNPGSYVYFLYLRIDGENPLAGGVISGARDARKLCVIVDRGSISYVADGVNRGTAPLENTIDWSDAVLWLLRNSMYSTWRNNGYVRDLSVFPSALSIQEAVELTAL